MMKPHVIAICAPAPRNGKTTIANHLIDSYGYTKVSFADPMRNMLKTLLLDCGTPAQEIERYFTKDKYEIIPEVGTSYRRLLTTLGTEWGRQLINKNLWVKPTVSLIRQLVNKNYPVVIDDMRFMSEYEGLKAISAMYIRVERPGAYPNPRIQQIRRLLYFVPVIGAHRSEGELNRVKPSATLINDSTIRHLTNKVDTILYEWNKELTPYVDHIRL